VALGSFVAVGGPVRAGERWFRDPQHAVLFYEHGLFVTHVDGWLALGKDWDVAAEVLWIAAHSWLPDRIVALHPENRLIPVTSVLEAHFRVNRLLLRDELALTLGDGSRVKLNWSTIFRLGVLQDGAVVRFGYSQEKLLMRRVFGDRLSSD